MKGVSQCNLLVQLTGMNTPDAGGAFKVDVLIADLPNGDTVATIVVLALPLWKQTTGDRKQPGVAYILVIFCLAQLNPTQLTRGSP